MARVRPPRAPSPLAGLARALMMGAWVLVGAWCAIAATARLEAWLFGPAREAPLK